MISTHHLYLRAASDPYPLYVQQLEEINFFLDLRWPSLVRSGKAPQGAPLNDLFKSESWDPNALMVACAYHLVGKSVHNAVSGFHIVDDPTVFCHEVRWVYPRYAFSETGEKVRAKWESYLIPYITINDQKAIFGVRTSIDRSIARSFLDRIAALNKRAILSDSGDSFSLADLMMCLFQGSPYGVVKSEGKKDRPVSVFLQHDDPCHDRRLTLLMEDGMSYYECEWSYNVGFPISDFVRKTNPVIVEFVRVE